MAGKSNEEVYDEAEALANAIAGTEDEIFSDAMDKEQDDNDGDRSLEEMDDDDSSSEDDEGDEDDEDSEGEADDGDDDEVGDDDDVSPPADRKPEGRVPPHRLREETARREVAEAEARAARAERDALNARLTALERGAPRAEAPQAPAKPDIFADPEGYERYVIAQADRAAETRFLNASLADAADQHGEKFTAAYKALTSLNSADPTDRATVQRIISAPNPGRAVMKWHSEQALLREVGSDPDAYRQKVAKEIMQDPEFRQRVIDGMRGEANRGDGGRPRTAIRIPRSLSEAGGRGGQSPRTRDPDATNNTDASVFEYATRR
jgi:hypothetical protein